MRPVTRFAKSGDVHVAYQVAGGGSIDLVWNIGIASNIETIWEEPSYAAFLRRLSSFSRLILLDRRGSGLSDRTPETATPTLDDRMEDILAVLDAVGSERAAMFGFSEGGTVSVLFSATHPERTSALVTYGTLVRALLDDDHPYGFLDADAVELFIQMFAAHWGAETAGEVGVPLWAPSKGGDPSFENWFGSYTRQSLSRGAVEPYVRAMVNLDVSPVLSAIRVPTLVIHRTDDTLIPVRMGRYIAEQIPGARYVELPGIDHLPFVGDADAILDEVQEFLTGVRGAMQPDRRLATVLFTDIVGSTQHAVELGDREWRRLLERHDSAIREQLVRFGGRAVKQTGDGFLATFEGPARAIECALAIGDAADLLGIELRMGLHTGECELLDDDIGGIAVHTGARVAELAGPSEILVSSTLRDLVAGSGVRFGEGRIAELEGLGRREVYPVLRVGASPRSVRRFASAADNVFRLEGEYWTVAFAGKVVSLKDSKGMRDIANLLLRPGRETHVLDLVREVERTAPHVHKTTRTKRDVAELDLRATGHGRDEVADAQARGAYRTRAAELEEEIGEAERDEDIERASKLKEELAFLADHLAALYGLGGRARSHVDDVERARKAVTNRIRDALDRIEREHMSLGAHLKRTLKTGLFCSYSPERPTNWLF